MKLSHRTSAELVTWAETRIPCLNGRGFPSATTAMGIENKAGEVIGVVAFHSWDPDSGTIEVSAVAEDARWLLARRAIAAMWDYAFNACGCQKIWSRTPRRNERALRMLRALGFQYEAILRRQFGDDDAVISARFREEYYEQAQTARAA